MQVSEHAEQDIGIAFLQPLGNLVHQQQPIGRVRTFHLPHRFALVALTEAQRRELAETLESELRWTEGALRSRVAHLISTSPTRNPPPTTTS